jgi:predicted DNA-binding transcriptional regulator YafY
MTWYLVARAPNGLRTYRVSRMQNVTMLATTFERPNFDLAAFWEASTAKLREQRQRYQATLSVDAEFAQSLITWCTASPAAGEDSPDLPGKTVLHVTFDSEEHARFVVLGFGPRAWVLSPAALRERVLADAAAVAALAARGHVASAGLGISNSEARSHRKRARQPAVRGDASR